MPSYCDAFVFHLRQQPSARPGPAFMLRNGTTVSARKKCQEDVRELLKTPDRLPEQPDCQANEEPEKRRCKHDDDNCCIDAIDGAFYFTDISTLGIISHQMILPRTIWAELTMFSGLFKLPAHCIAVVRRNI